ncbi:hypothetical protein PoB_003791800 [Plakobranchus ocellatus]|uniref:Uncharacterized protein n=1 Tax=Plakobranchus ocellatus TaxID=259542 RepID=A0AAV4AY54_9GAST|nr:hypothetical protein PoB_003791800 [Plakobranchus ocellatus]
MLRSAVSLACQDFCSVYGSPLAGWYGRGEAAFVPQADWTVCAVMTSPHHKGERPECLVQGTTILCGGTSKDRKDKIMLTEPRPVVGEDLTLADGRVNRMAYTNFEPLSFPTGVTSGS